MAVLPYTMIHFLYALFVPFSTFITGKIGTNRSLTIAFLLFAVSSVPMYMFAILMNFSLYLFWALIYLLGKLFFHPSSILIQGMNSTYINRGKTFSFKKIFIIIIAIATPIVGAYVATFFGLKGLAVFSSTVYLLAVITTFNLQKNTFKFDIKETLSFVKNQHQVHKIYKINLFSSIQKTLLKLWPLYMFLILDSNFLDLGYFLSAVALIGLLISYFMGMMLDVYPRELIFTKSLFLGALFWLFKGIFLNPSFLVVVDAIHKPVYESIDESRNVLTYDLMMNKTNVGDRDEIIIAKEVGLNLIIAILLATYAISITLTSFTTVFVAMAIISLVSLKFIYNKF